MTLLVPDLVEQAMVDLLGSRHAEHLAALERQLDLAPQTIERLQTVTVIDDGDQRLSGEPLPWLGLGIDGFSDEPDRVTLGDNRTSLTIPWRVVVEIIVQGGGRDPRTDAMQRARWTSMTVAECLLQRLPRQGGPFEQIQWGSFALETGEGPGGTIAQAELVFSVAVTDSLTVLGPGVLPIEGLAPDGAVGGAPAGPYDVPAQLPDVEHFDVTFRRSGDTA